MEIEHKFDFVTGNFDTLDGELICVANEKYQTVNLCFKENMNITFAKIRLHTRDLYVDSKAVFASAKQLGDEIARRWNCTSDKR